VQVVSARSDPAGDSEIRWSTVERDHWFGPAICRDGHQPNVSGFSGRYGAFDRFQQRHAWLGFPLAVRQKYADDQGGYLAATISYYGFFPVFPLLLVFTTLLGNVLRAHHHL